MLLQTVHTQSYFYMQTDYKTISQLCLLGLMGLTQFNAMCHYESSES